MKKGFFHSFFGMTFLFAFVVFLSLGSGILISAGVIYLLVRNGVMELETALIPHVGRLFTTLAIVSLPVGIVVAAVASKVPLKPIRDLIASMDKLASGDFGTRVSVGPVMKNYPAFVQLTQSFNRMAQELENTEVLRTDFINNFSHEFKTPIVSIAGFAELLRRGDLTEEQRSEYLDIIHEESKRLSHIATNALNLTRVENQAILTDVTSFNLSEQLRHCVLLLEDQWTRKALEPDMEFGEFTVRGNEELLKQVWINLVDNAVKFSPPGGLLTIAITPGPGRLSVSVTNSGDPIPAPVQAKIWNKFYQGDESHATMGNGIGLAIVKQVVKLHRGSVSVQSKGGKNTFTVTLPADL